MIAANDDDPEIEDSPLSGETTRDGVTVDVRIYRLKEPGSLWSLEVVDETGASTVWDDQFSTDVAAHEAFVHTAETEGMHTFLGDDYRPQ